MSTTTMPNMKEIKRTWYILDAEGKSLGRVAAQAAAILRGKHKLPMRTVAIMSSSSTVQRQYSPARSWRTSTSTGTLAGSAV